MVQTGPYTSPRTVWLLQTRLGSAGTSAAGQASAKLTLEKRSPLRIQVARRELVPIGFVKLGLKSPEPLREKDWLWLRVPLCHLWVPGETGHAGKASRMQT